MYNDIFMYLNKKIKNINNNNSVNLNTVFQLDTEYDTGQIWFDGKSIYRKILQISSITDNHGSNNISHGIDFETIIRFEGMARTSEVYGYWNDISDKYMSNGNIYLDDTYITIYKGGDVDGLDGRTYVAHVIVEYTKP